MTTIISLLGMATLLLIAYLSSRHRADISLRTVGGAFALQAMLGGFALYFPAGRSALESVSSGVSNVLNYGQEGIRFLFGDIGTFKIGFVFAFHVLPVIIFFSSLVAILYYLGIMTWIIKIIGGGVQKLLGTRHAESMSATANVFVSQTEAPLLIKPYISSLSKSELLAVMVGGMATVAGSVLAGYVALGVEMKYLIAASFMAAPGGLLMAKIMLPEREEMNPDEDAPIAEEQHQYTNVIDAAAGGASAGLGLAVNIGAMLIAFIGLIALANGILGWAGTFVGIPELTLQQIFGICFKPVAFILGIPWSESGVAGSLIGQKLVLNEFIAFAEFGEQKALLSAHSQAVVSFALCGFANLSSMAIMLGGLGTLAPERRHELAELGMRAVMAAFMANLMSAAIASFYLSLN